VQYVVPFLLQFLLYASPIAYATSAVPTRYRVIYDINPLSWSLQEFRFSLLHAPCPPAWQIIASVLVAAGVLFLGTMYFEHEERGFADYI
jgi:lipopolysaccharide transport system permease protein